LDTEPNPKSPNLNAFGERWVQSVQVECLDHFVVLGEDHLRYLVREYVDYFNTERPHQAMDNCTLAGPAERAPCEGEVLCRERLGGLLRHYYRKAARTEAAARGEKACRRCRLLHSLSLL
jgi:putative transposase